MTPKSVALDPSVFSPDVEEIVSKLKARTVGQDHAVEAFGRILETFLAGYHDPERPVGVVLELGPTGTGKTRSRRPTSQKQLRARARKRAAALWLVSVFALDVFSDAQAKRPAPARPVTAQIPVGQIAVFGFISR